MKPGNIPQENIPQDLKNGGLWCLWKYEDRKGKRTKPPYSPSGKYANSSDPNTFTDFRTAYAAYQRGGFEGLGLGIFNGFCAVDIDHCIDPAGLSDMARDIIDIMDSYTEVSPSGEGIRILFKASDFQYDKARYYVNNQKKGLEVYMEGATHKYVTITGQALHNKPIAERGRQIAAVLEKYMKRQPNAEGTPRPALSAPEYLARGLDKDARLRALWDGQRDTADESGNDLALMNKLAYWCNRDESQMIEAFIRSPYAAGKDDAHRKKMQREDYLHRTAGMAIAGCQRTAAEDDAAYKLERARLDFGESPEALPNFFDGKRFLHHVMGEYLIHKLHACKINGVVHIYEKGVYKPGEEVLHGHMVQLVPSLTDMRRKEVYKYIKISPHTPEKKLAPPTLIPFATKIYDIEAGRFLDYSPAHVFLNRFPYDYIPDAAAVPLVDETLDAITCGDLEVKSLLLEAVGNCFYLLNQYRGAVMLYGSGNNGKSTLLNMITQLLGKENASHLSLQDLAERFRLIEIYGRAANIGDDIPGAYIPDSSYFKKAVTGEYLTAEKKGQDPISFKPYAKMFFAMNALPAVSDKSKGFFSRVLLIPLAQDFSKLPGRDPRLKDRKWTREEMEYLTRLAMEGLSRLIAQGDFTRPLVVQQAVEEYERENNPVKEFLESYGSVEGKPTGAVYSEFRGWCYDNGHKNVPTQAKFTREVTAQTGMSSKPARINGIPARRFLAS